MIHLNYYHLNKLYFLLLVVLHVYNPLPGQPLSDISLVKQFNDYHRQSFTEKIYVQTDKPFYLAGETIWFKVYYLEGTHHRPASLSKIAYLDVIDKDNKPAAETMITLTGGSGNGWIQLPFSVASGMFRLRAYTSWMKNFDSDFYFEKPVTIVNTLKPLDSLPPRYLQYETQLFPEGGHLVRDLESKVAFRITASGKGLTGKGVIVRNNSDTIGSFNILKFGMGHFNILPDAGSTYKAVFKTADTILTSPLPEVLRSGYVMKLDKSAADQLTITITTNVSGADSAILFVHTRHAVKYAGSKKFNNGVATFSIDKKIPGEGISHFTVFNEARQPVCERLYFVQPAQRLSITATTDKVEYHNREKVTISVAASDRSVSAGVASLSLSVYPVDALQAAPGAGLLTYSWLQSDLRGRIESPQYYFEDTSAVVDEAADLLMLTHGWRRFSWQDVLTNRNREISFLPELSDHILHTKTTRAESGLAASDIVTYLSIPGNPIQLYGGKSNAEGITRYNVKQLFGKNELVFQPADTTSRMHFTARSPFSQRISNTPWPAFTLPENTASLLLDYSINVQVQHAFARDETLMLSKPAADTTAFYGIPDAAYYLDNYVRFSAMEDVLREYVPGVIVRRRREDFHLIMSEGNTQRFLDDPLTLINGIPVSTNKIMQFNPLKAKKLEVVKRKYYYGPLVFNGIINFTTYQPDREVLSGLNATILEYEGVQYERTFYSPVYETSLQAANRLPDFRNTLYWSPDIMKGKREQADVVFYTADKKGEYIVVIEGMNAAGNIGTTSLRFRVK